MACKTWLSAPRSVEASENEVALLWQDGRVQFHDGEEWQRAETKGGFVCVTFMSKGCADMAWWRTAERVVLVLAEPSRGLRLVEGDETSACVAASPEDDKARAVSKSAQAVCAQGDTVVVVVASFSFLLFFKGARRLRRG